MDLTAFLAGNASKIDKEKYVVSSRFQKDGKPVEWELICITASENNQIRESCYKSVANQVRGESSRVLDTGLYQAKITARCVVYPDLENVELQNSYGVVSADELITTMLNPGEFENLSEKVLLLNGFKNDLELTQEAKN